MPRLTQWPLIEWTPADTELLDTYVSLTTLVNLISRSQNCYDPDASESEMYEALDVNRGGISGRPPCAMQ